MTALIKYEAARSALAEARSIDEVKDILDKAEALRAYGRMANDTQLEIDATEIRLRAERRLGALLTQAKTNGQLGKGRPQKNGCDDQPFPRLTLEELGITKELSSRSQKVGGIAERAFELMIDNMRRRMGQDRTRVSLDLLKDGDKKQQRANREAELGRKQLALPDKKYGVIYADPEWRFEPYSRESGMDRAPENYYPTSATDAIAARPVEKIAAEDCVLFLWATAPMLPDALDVMLAWGFAYKSQVIWKKDRIGTGYWFRNAHELLLVGTRGKIPAPAPGTQWPSVVEAEVGAHSEKPAKFYELIESYFQTLPKIELNARRARKGWDAWGLDAPPHDPETGEILEAAE